MILENIDLNEFALNLGLGLLTLVDEEKERSLLTAVRQLRKELTGCPPIRICDNCKLDSNEYRVHWNDKEIKNKVLQSDSTENQIAKIVQDVRTVFEQNNL